MRVLVTILWMLALLIVLSLGFETVIWYFITPITISVAQLSWLERMVNLGAVFCSVLFLALLRFWGGKPK